MAFPSVGGGRRGAVIYLLLSKETSGVSLPQRQTVLILELSSMKGGLGPGGLLMKSLGSSAVEINSYAHWLLGPSCKLTASLLG